MTSAASHLAEPAARLSPLTLVNAVLRRRWLVAGLPLLLGLLAAIHASFTRSHTATATFVPQIAQSSTSRLAGVAAQFGFSIGAPSGGETVDFYARLLTSRQMLEDAVRTTYGFPAEASNPAGDSVRGDYATLNGIEGDTPRQRLNRSVSHLRERITVRPDYASGIVTFSVESRWPAFAEVLNRQMLDQLADFNLRRRQSQAGAERRFVEARHEEARAELREAELALQRFFEANRSFRDSPRLSFEATRLQAVVARHEQLVAGLAQAFEQARIDEVRDTPVITTVDAPEGSARASFQVSMRAMLGIVVGLILALFIVVVSEYLGFERRDHPETYSTFESLWRATLAMLVPRRSWFTRSRERPR